MGFGFEHGHYYNMTCIDCPHNKLPEVCYGQCDQDCCMKCSAAELHTGILKSPKTDDIKLYSIGLYCVFGSAYPGRSCEHYCDITKEEV